MLWLWDANGVAMICMSFFKKPPTRTVFAEQKGLLSEEFQWDVMDCVWRSGLKLELKSVET